MHYFFIIDKMPLWADEMF